jgi:hypothetical protein
MSTPAIVDPLAELGPEEVKSIRLEIRRMFEEMERLDTRIEENWRRFDQAQAVTRRNLIRIKELMSNDVA